MKQHARKDMGYAYSKRETPNIKGTMAHMVKSNKNACARDGRATVFNLSFGPPDHPLWPLWFFVEFRNEASKYR